MIDQVKNISNINDLVPNLVIFGCDEIIPGIKDDFMPNEISPNFDIQVTPRFDAFLERISVRFSQNILNSIKQDCTRYRNDNFNLNGQNVSDVYIREVNLVAGYHNGWRFCNKDGDLNQIKLAGDPQTHIYTAASALSVCNVFFHELTALILQLEVVVMLPIGSGRDERKKLMLGWRPIFLDSDDPSSNRDITRPFYLGPGKNLAREEMYEIAGKDDKTKIDFSFVLNTQNSKYSRDKINIENNPNDPKT